METWESEMERIEATIRTTEGDRLRARWKSGHHMQALRGDTKQLPHGMLDRMATNLGASRSELGARMSSLRSPRPRSNCLTPLESLGHGTRLFGAA
jgi:hypothetical protein